MCLYMKTNDEGCILICKTCFHVRWCDYFQFLCFTLKYSYSSLQNECVARAEMVKSFINLYEATHRLVDNQNKFKRGRNVFLLQYTIHDRGSIVSSG